MGASTVDQGRISVQTNLRGRSKPLRLPPDQNGVDTEQRAVHQSVTVLLTNDVHTQDRETLMKRQLHIDNEPRQRSIFPSPENRTDGGEERDPDESLSSTCCLEPRRSVSAPRDNRMFRSTIERVGFYDRSTENSKTLWRLAHGGASVLINRI